MDGQGRVWKFDVLVNNAGVMPHSFLYKKKIDDWNKMNFFLKAIGKLDDGGLWIKYVTNCDSTTSN
ncbi:hypothetical protein [Heyndrickxia acidicola]|uniref:Uncharacterized protein n=1 Tax=Heyndrickxia acidicola TaxID=209389 RepID=A0ABU6MM96_9BACI|nr:hypothetical protein [Heyndrickxia acidicola]MED1205801.1 hypothetical protein [Heyndrickxia acidicola]